MRTFFKHDQPTRRQTKARVARREQDERNRARRVVYGHFGGCCAKCGRPLKLTPADARTAFEIGHVDEVIERSLGGDPADATTQMLFCYDCHALKTAKKFWVKCHDRQRGTFGPFEFVAGPRPHGIDAFGDSRFASS